MANLPHFRGKDKGGKHGRHLLIFLYVLLFFLVAEIFIRSILVRILPKAWQAEALEMAVGGSGWSEILFWIYFLSVFSAVLFMARTVRNNIRKGE